MSLRPFGVWREMLFGAERDSEPEIGCAAQGGRFDEFLDGDTVAGEIFPGRPDEPHHAVSSL